VADLLPMDRRVAEQMIAVLETRLTLAEQEAAARRDAINLLCSYAGLPLRYPGAPRQKSAAYEAALAAVEQMAHEPSEQMAAELVDRQP
jgi:hypothetical protein